MALAAGALAAAGLVVGLTATRAQEPAKSEKPPAKPFALVVPKITGVALAGPDLEVVQTINKHLEAGWKANSLQPSRPADDYEFIRRVTLDVIGRIATPEEIAAFLKEPRESRRSALVKRLLDSDEYPRHWANLWANWLLTRSGPFGHGPEGSYHEKTQEWLKDQFAQNKPHDELVKALITAEGKNTDNGAVNFILAHVGEPVPRGKQSEEGQFDMVPITSRITRLFLGIQTQCAQCHDHPSDDRLRQDHFWGVNAFLRQVAREGTPPNVENRRMMAYPPLTLKDNSGANAEAAVFFEKRNGVVLQTRAKFLDGTKMPAETENRREMLARLVVEHENFPRAFANRMWAHFFGRGFTNPVDDFHEQNEPTNPALLDDLAKQFKHYKFDQKKLITWLCNSTAYHLSCAANKTNDKPDAEPFFSRMLLKAMSPEQLYESLMLATQRDATAEARRQERNRWLDQLIDNFGDDEGNEVSFNGTVVQALLMMNGAEINQAIAGGNGIVGKLMGKRGATPDSVIRELYLAALNRPPTAREVARVKNAFPLRVGRDVNAMAPYQDLLWALVNSNEFILNH
jgi:hypothetical protein